ncbi:MAG: fumarate reductase cytochrome b subunit [Candidatus Latescibacterota bacterium]|nr:MAG: fumarate reductase cytochrome b subunit [Candidatus Latescibacterota bacterium]
MKNLLEDIGSRSRWPARLDVTQSVTGLALALFMWVHLVLVSSILLGKDAMYYVTGFFELKFLTGWTHGYPIIVSIIGIIVFAIFIIHAGIALRKFPISWRQHRIYRDQMSMMKHSDTNLWYWQAVTGFVMFFLGSVHVYVMISHPDQIGPYASADRFVSENFWPLYLVLLFSVELHGTIGMYRLAVKWGPFDGKDPRKNRKRLKRLKTTLTFAFLIIGIITFATYVKIGIDHRGSAGERYAPPGHSSAMLEGGEVE